MARQIIPKCETQQVRQVQQTLPAQRKGAARRRAAPFRSGLPRYTSDGSRR
jgi:hypothetical protein